MNWSENPSNPMDDILAAREIMEASPLADLKRSLGYEPQGIVCHPTTYPELRDTEDDTLKGLPRQLIVLSGFRGGQTLLGLPVLLFDWCPTDKILFGDARHWALWQALDAAVLLINRILSRLMVRNAELTLETNPWMRRDRLKRIARLNAVYSQWSTRAKLLHSQAVAAMEAARESTLG